MQNLGYSFALERIEFAKFQSIYISLYAFSAYHFLGCYQSLIIVVTSIILHYKTLNDPFLN